MDVMNRYAAAAAVLGLACLGAIVAAVPAEAAARPVVTSLSSHHGVYWGGGQLTIHGQNLVGVKKVTFGRSTGYGVNVVSATTLTVYVPEHAYGTVDVRVDTSGGASVASTADRYTFTRPTMTTPIQGGLTARQEQSISASVRAKHHNAHIAAHAKRWTAAMGQTAANRARSWLGLPYAWDGGNSKGPTHGVCAHNGGDLDCHVIGFDCSGLTLYAWAPYKTLSHYAQTQHSQAGKFHPAIGELMPGDLVFFSAYLSGGIGHVAVYIGNGQVVEAPESGQQVRVSLLANLIAWDGVYRGATRPTSTGKQGASPVVTSITSSVSIKGGTVTVRGHNLLTATSVTIAGTRVYSFSTRTATKLVFTAPPRAAGTSNVYVYNSWGSAHETIAYVGSPQLTALSATSGSTAGGNTITISGHNLGAVTKVQVGTTSVAFKAVGTTTLTLTMPAAQTYGPVPIVASSPYGTSNSLTYTYLAPAPPSSSPSGS
jgi:cell wall-associated NlpC family hydrolase